MNEAETRADLIDPALRAAGWGENGSRVLRERYCEIAPGRLIGGGRRAKAEIADYILVYCNTKLAVIEAKKRDLPVTEGLAQAKAYARKLQLRYTYSTNGLGIYQVDRDTGAEGEIDRYPTPDELWEMTYGDTCDWRDRFSEVPFEDKGGTFQPRYYQDLAIQKTLEAVAKGKDRILLTLATGTGKTCIAFQLAWKLFHSKWNLSREPNRRPRILFLADRNILANQAFNSFSAFDEDALVRISPKEIRKTGHVPKNGAVFFTIFQTFMTVEYGETEPVLRFEGYSPDFFDFIIIDECHRGGAKDESNWRGILEHFSPAVQLGLTATPLRKHNADTYAYFGQPVFTYALKEGINDGFLTPFKVNQIKTTLDDYVYTSDDDVLDGEVTAGKVYEEHDFNRIIEIKERETKRVEIFLSMIDQSEKTIVFCQTQDHALAVRDLINQLSTSTNPDYCARVTANDGSRGEEALSAFQDNEKTIPTILTTSQKLSTGVDAKNVRHVVLMRPVNSMIEFKQIVGRGTRVFEGKDYFTIHDFVEAYKHFADDEWDGEPLDPVGGTPRTPGEPRTPAGGEEGFDGGDEGNGERPKMIKVKLADGKYRNIQHMAQTSFWGPDGIPLSAEEFLKQLYGDLPDFFEDEAELRELWSHPDTRQRLLSALEEKGYGAKQLDEIREIIGAPISDIFDVLAHVAYSNGLMTREERAESHRPLIYAHYDDKQKVFIDFVLSHYVHEGVGELAVEKLPDYLQLKYNGLPEAKAELGDVQQIRDVFVGFQRYLFEQIQPAA